MSITTVTDSFSRTYPRTVTSSEGSIVLRLMAAEDADAVLAFAQALPAHDLLFCRATSPSPR